MDREVPRNRTMIMVIGEAGSGGRNPGYENFSMFLGWPTWHTGAHVVMNDPAIVQVLTSEYEWTIEGWEYRFDELTVSLKERLLDDGKPLNADDWVFMFNYLRDAVGKVGELAAIDARSRRIHCDAQPEVEHHHQQQPRCNRTDAAGGCVG